MAFQIIKPVETHGIIFQGIQYENCDIHWQGTHIRWPMTAGQWANLRAFDEPLLEATLPVLDNVRAVMSGPNIAMRNAVHLLQLALEQFHPYVACLLAVAGMEAILESRNRRDFQAKLCGLLGPSTRAFPDWNSPHFPQLTYSVKELALPLYTLRSKVAHGADLRKAVQDRHSPVDLHEMKEYIWEGAPVHNATLLNESSIYLLGQVLQKKLLTTC